MLFTFSATMFIMQHLILVWKCFDSEPIKNLEFCNELVSAQEWQKQQ